MVFRSEQQIVDAAAWNVFAAHQPFYHVLSDRRMLDAGPREQQEFWAAGDADVRQLMAFGGLQRVAGVAVDFGCGIGRLTRALVPFADRQLGIDISPEMIVRATALHRDCASIEFRTIVADQWPVESVSAALVISLHVFNHLSSIALMEKALAQCGRVLKKGGHAVIGLQTMTLKGEIAQWCLRAVRGSRLRFDFEMRDKLLAADRGDSAEFTEDEIFDRLMLMEFRRLKSMPLRRLRRALRAARLKIRRFVRNPHNGGSLLAAEKV